MQPDRRAPTLTLIFYATDGQAAKRRARELTVGTKNKTMIYDVGAWDDKRRPCDVVEIMPDVPRWSRERIEVVYGDLARRESSVEVADPELQTADVGSATQSSAPISKTVEHRGRGKWYVMRGGEEISGPHTSTEAERLAAE